MICNKCGQDKIRKRAEPKPLKKDGRKSGYRFRDELGKRWNGNTCPSCTRVKKKDVVQKTVVVCNKCKKAKEKIRAEVRPPKNGKKSGNYFRDTNGRMWQGNTCPDCFWPVDETYVKPVIDKEVVAEDWFIDDPLTERQCRKCYNFLPKSRYFRCSGCEVKDVRDLLEAW
jgi:hypothetical protein